MTTPRRKCLVLGSGGFIGSHLVEGLLAAGHSVRCFDRSHLASRIQWAADNSVDCEFTVGDFEHDEDIARSLDGMEVCFHLISTTNPATSNLDPLHDLNSNGVTTLKLLSAANRSTVRKIIFASSGGTVYGVPTAIPITETHATDPICSYGIVKLLIEKYLLLNCRENGLPFMSLRIANPFGPRQAAHSGQGAVAAFLRKALLGQEIEIWGDGTVVRDYIYISDVVDAFLLAIDFDGSERVMNIGSGVGLSINDLLICIEAVVNHPIRRRYLGRRSFDVPINVLDVSRARNLLGWAPKIDFRSGAQLSADWIQQHEII